MPPRIRYSPLLLPLHVSIEPHPGCRSHHGSDLLVPSTPTGLSSSSVNPDNDRSPLHKRPTRSALYPCSVQLGTPLRHNTSLGRRGRWEKGLHGCVYLWSCWYCCWMVTVGKAVKWWGIIELHSSALLNLGLHELPALPLHLWYWWGRWVGCLYSVCVCWHCICVYKHDYVNIWTMFCVTCNVSIAVFVCCLCSLFMLTYEFECL